MGTPGARSEAPDVSSAAELLIRGLSAVARALEIPHDAILIVRERDNPKARPLACALDADVGTIALRMGVGVHGYGLRSAWLRREG